MRRLAPLALAPLAAVLLALAGIVTAPAASAQAGTADPTFGTGGVQAFPALGYPAALAAQPDGALVAGGASADGPAIVRTHDDGTPDVTFGTGGRVGLAGLPLESFVTAVVVQPGGHLVAVGLAPRTDDSDDVFVARLSADGQPDTAFGPGGVRRLGVEAGSNPPAVALVPGSGFVVSTADGMAARVMRFDAAGTPDATFGVGGGAEIYATDGTDLFSALPTAILVDAAGRIVVAGSAGSGSTGYRLFAARLAPSGQLDATFNADGTIPGVALVRTPSDFSLGRAAALGPQGLVIAGYDSYGYIGDVDASGMLVARITDAGTLDATFGEGGLVSFRGPTGNAIGFAVGVTPGGEIVVGGALGSIFGLEDRAAVVRFTKTGAPDTTFGDAGVAAVGLDEMSLVSAVVLLPGGRIVAAGMSGVDAAPTGFLARLLGDAATAGEPGAAGVFALAIDGANPFRGETSVRVTLAAAADVRVAVYDVQGRRVATLADGPRAAGEHRLRVDAAGLAAGAYVVRAEAGAQSAACRLTLAR